MTRIANYIRGGAWFPPVVMIVTIGMGIAGPALTYYMDDGIWMLLTCIAIIPYL